MCNCSNQQKKEYFVELSVSGSVRACCLDEATSMADSPSSWDTVDQDILSVEEIKENQ